MDKPHKRLRCWQLGMDIVMDIYKSTKRFPPEEKYGLISQMRRSAVSVPSNIAEGSARNSKKEFINFLYISSGSLSELDTQIEVAKRLGFLSHEQWTYLDEKLTEEDKVICGLIKHQKASS